MISRLLTLSFKRSTLTHLTSLTAAGLLSGTALADSHDDGIIVGIGFNAESALYKDMSNETNPMFFAFGQYGDLWFAGQKMGYTVYENGGLSISPVLSLTGVEGFETSDADSNSALYHGLSDREGGHQYGLQAVYQTSMGELSAAYMIDSEEGSSIDLAFAKHFEPTPDLTLVPSIYAHIRDKDLNDFYYGIDADEIAPGRAAYRADSGVDYGIDVTASYRMSDNWHMFGRVAYDIYDSTVEDSPLVDDGNVASLAVGIGYKF